MKVEIVALAFLISGVEAAKTPRRRQLTDPALTVTTVPSKVENAYILTLCEDHASVEGEDEVLQYIADADADAAVPDWHGSVNFAIKPTRKSSRHFMVTLKDTTPEAIADLLTMSAICAVVEDGVVTAADLPGSWGLDRIDQADLPLDDTFTQPRGLDGSGVDVYVLDTGLDATHDQFGNGVRTVANVWDGYDTTNCPGNVCGGGRIGGGLGTNNDENGHGSHCAGTVGGETVGVAPKANIFGVKVLGPDGTGSMSTVTAAMSWVADQAATTGNPTIASMSIQASGANIFDAQVDDLVDARVIVTVAAGNSGEDACTYSPSSSANAITVGSTKCTDCGGEDASEAVSKFSNYGTCLDVYAPGSDIESVATSYSTGSTSGLQLRDGTSMACPHVAGIAALALEETPTLSPAGFAAKLQADAVPNKLDTVEDGAWSDATARLLAQVPSSPPTCVNLLVTMADTPDNGWNGNYLYLGDHMVTLPSGGAGTATVCLEPGTYTPYACGGYDPDEVSWEVGGINGGVDCGTGPCSCDGLPGVGAASFEVAEPNANTGAICFTGSSLLTLEDGSTKKFRDLEVGDMILSADRSGKISASPVLFLPHPDNDITRKFDEVTLANGMVVRMTRNHLLPLCDGSLVTARSLKEGDCLMTKDGTSKVATTKHNVEAGGIYTAVTKQEFLVVDGVVASPFALAHGIAHSFFDREDVAEWCKDNSHLVDHTADEEIKSIVGSSRRRRLTEGSPENNKESGCVDLMETLFENYKDEGVGWGTNGWGYKNFGTTQLRGATAPAQTMAMRLSGFHE